VAVRLERSELSLLIGPRGSEKPEFETMVTSKEVHELEY
jgi:hypothetical protein